MAENSLISGGPVFVSKPARLPYLPTMDLRRDILDMIYGSKQRTYYWLGQIENVVDEHFTHVEQCFDKAREQFNIVEKGFKQIDLSINGQFASTNKTLEAINAHVVSLEERMNTNAELVASCFIFLGNCFDFIGNSFHLQNLPIEQIQQQLLKMKFFLNIVRVLQSGTSTGNTCSR